jgi:hypothetical protein
MRRKRRCPYCHRLFLPHAQSWCSSTGIYRQKVCSVPACQRKRRLQNLKDYWEDNPLIGSSLRSYREQQKSWKKKKAKAYMRVYRRANCDYVKRNQELQRERNRKRRMIVKQDSIDVVHIEKLKRIRRLPLIVKQDPIQDVQSAQIDGLCRYLEWTRVIVKHDSIALQEKIAHNHGHESTS